MNDHFPGRLAFQQRLLPAYRAPFFDALAGACAGGLAVYAGQPGPDESILPASSLERAALEYGRNLYLFPRRILLVWQPGLIHFLERENPDALVVEANPRNQSLPAAVRWMHRRGRPVLGWGLGAPPAGGITGGWLVRVRRSLLQSFDGLIAYSRKGAEEFHQNGIPPEKIFTAANAVSPRPAPAALRPVKDGPPVVLFVGRLQPRKRVDYLLAACASLPPALQPRLQIVGDGPARPELERLAASIYPQAEFTGARSGADLDETFRQADLFVLPGTGGLAIQEAMAAGLPVIAAEADGTQADLVRLENGWCIPPGDQAALNQVLLDALSDRERLRHMGASSARIVAEEINLEGMVAAFLQALETIRGYNHDR